MLKLFVGIAYVMVKPSVRALLAAEARPSSLLLAPVALLLLLSPSALPLVWRAALEQRLPEGWAGTADTL